MLSRLIAEQALAAALRTGGDFAEIFYEDTRSSSLTLNAGAIETALTGRTAGAGVRVYKGLSSVYVHTNDASLSGLVRAAQKAADAIGSADRVVDVHLTGAVARNIHAIAQLPLDVPGARRAQVVKAADAAARAVSAEITQEMCIRDRTRALPTPSSRCANAATRTLKAASTPACATRSSTRRARRPCIGM